MPLLNKSSSDCEVYALKHIECHLQNLDFSLVNDNNIRETRQKIAYDLWEAANDHVLISRMAQFTPPKTITNPVVELEWRFFNYGLCRKNVLFDSFICLS